MTTAEVIVLVQTVILFGTGVVVGFYTWETRRMRAVAADQFEVMRQTLQLQLAEQKRAAEPILIWGGGKAQPDHVEWEFTNEGGPISYLTVSMGAFEKPAPAGVQAHITPTDWLGTHGHGKIAFDGSASADLPFQIGFRTRLGSVGVFFFIASRTNKPVWAGSGWV